MGMGWASGGPLGGATSWPGAPGGTSPDGSLAGGGGGGGSHGGAAATPAGTAAPVEAVAVVASATPTAPACRTAR